MQNRSVTKTDMKQGIFIILCQWSLFLAQYVIPIENNAEYDIDS